MNSDIQPSHPSQRHHLARPMLRTAIMLLLGCKLVADIVKRALGGTPPLPRKLIYVRSFARRIPGRGQH